MNQLGAIVEGAGTAAEGFVATIAVEPASELAPPGRTFADQFRKRYGTYLCCFSVASATAARMALDAVAPVDGARTRMAAALLGAHVTGGMAGDFKIEPPGATRSARIGVHG